MAKGSYGPRAFGGEDLPKPGAVVMQYTGHSEYNPSGEVPTSAGAGDNDGIANWQTMARRIKNLSAMDVDTQFRHYAGLGHGFGLGVGTVAEGWLDEAVAFWEKQMESGRDDK